MRHEISIFCDLGHFSPLDLCPIKRLWGRHERTFLRGAKQMKLIVKTLTLIAFTSQISFAGTLSGDSGTSGASVNTAANKTKSDNSDASSKAAQAAMMLAMQAMQQFAQCPPTNIAACMMGAALAAMAALAAGQSKENGDKSGQAASTAMNTDASSLAAADFQSLKNESGNAANKNLQAIAGKLKDGVAGSTADLSTGVIKTADGKSYNAADLASAGGMAAAGMSADQIAAVMAVAKKVDEKVGKGGALTATSGFDEGGGGSGGGAAGTTSETAGGLGGGGHGSKVDRSPAQVAGMSRDFNGEPIGVSGDSLFEMMNRRYKLKEKQNVFLDETDLALQK